MRAILVVNLLLGLFMLLWVASTEVRSTALASEIGNKQRFGRDKVAAPMEFSDLYELFERAKVSDARVAMGCAAVLIAGSVIGLQISRRSPD
jgi:hypothetical protein